MSANPSTCRRWTLTDRPVGRGDLIEYMHLEEVPVPTVQPGEIMIRVDSLRPEPATIGWMKGDTYVKAVPLGTAVRCTGTGVVVASQHPEVKVGERYIGRFPASEYFVTPYQDLFGMEGMSSVRVPGTGPSADWAASFSAGLAAYIGMFTIGEADKGTTVLVSGASGFVGHYALQMARIRGCRVVAIATGDATDRLLDLGADAIVDYKTKNLARAIRKACPEGVDLFLDNVGGRVLDATIRSVATRGTIVLCGASGVYDRLEERDVTNISLFRCITSRIRVQGFVTMDWQDEFPVVAEAMREWFDSGELKPVAYTTNPGLESLLPALDSLNKGERVSTVVSCE